MMSWVSARTFIRHHCYFFTRLQTLKNCDTTVTVWASENTSHMLLDVCRQTCRAKKMSAATAMTAIVVYRKMLRVKGCTVMSTKLCACSYLLHRDSQS